MTASNKVRAVYKWCKPRNIVATLGVDLNRPNGESTGVGVAFALTHDDLFHNETKTKIDPKHRQWLETRRIGLNFNSYRVAYNRI